MKYIVLIALIGVFIVFTIHKSTNSTVLGINAIALQNNDIGKNFYAQKCSLCHQENGEGIEGIYAPLSKSTTLLNKNKSIDILLNGMSGTTIIDGLPYSSVMHPVIGTDEELSEVLNYCLVNFCNQPGTITSHDIALRRKKRQNIQ